MGPYGELRKHYLLELVNTLRPFADECGTPEQREAARVVAKWSRAFQVWGWEKPLPAEAARGR